MALNVRRPGAGDDVLARARQNSRKENECSLGGFHYVAVQDHILESQCNHPEGERANCTRCRYDVALALPELPEMVFPNNSLTISFNDNPGCSISFNTLDALRMVCANALPDVQVAPSTVWQDARRDVASHPSPHPFDWTYTTNYSGTVEGCDVTETTERIDMDRLRQQENIKFYSSLTLYEDELADHGIAQMSARLRVMPNYFFALLRFYLRVDHVLVRVCDTRIVGDNGKDYVVREWSRREAKMSDLAHLEREVVLDGNRVWMHLPILESKNERITSKRSAP